MKMGFYQGQIKVKYSFLAKCATWVRVNVLFYLKHKAGSSWD